MLAILFALALQQASPPAAKDVTQVEGLEAVVSRSRIPVTTAEYEVLSVNWRVPHYSAEQMSSFVCMAREKMGYDLVSANQALIATQAFEATKLKVRDGSATMADLVAANERRQQAVEVLFGQQLRPANNSGAQRVSNRAPPTSSVIVEKTDFRIETREGRQVLVVGMILKNAGSKPETPGQVTIIALDRRGLSLADTTYRLGKDSLGAGERGRAEFVFENMPYYTHDIRVRTGPGGSGRNYRKCQVVEAFHPPGGLNLKVAAEDEIQNALDALPK